MARPGGSLLPSFPFISPSEFIMIESVESSESAPADEIESLLAEAARLVLPPLFTWEELRAMINSWCAPYSKMNEE